MAVSFQSTGDEDAVSATLKRVKDLHDLHPPTARQHQHLDVGRILQAERSRQVSSSVRTMLAAESEDVWFEVCGHRVSLAD
jgi:hypothetical protein